MEGLIWSVTVLLQEERLRWMDCVLLKAASLEQ